MSTKDLRRWYSQGLLNYDEYVTWLNLKWREYNARHKNTS